MKASNVVAPAKQTKVAPDLEEAFEEEDDGQAVAEVKDEDEEGDLKKDKYIKQPKAKKSTVGNKTASKKKAGKEDDEEELDFVDDDDDEEDAKPKKGKGKAKTSGTKGKGKK